MIIQYHIDWRQLIRRFGTGDMLIRDCVQYPLCSLCVSQPLCPPFVPAFREMMVLSYSFLYSSLGLGKRIVRPPVNS